MWNWIAKQAVKLAAWAVPRAEDLREIIAHILALRKKNQDD